MQILLLDPDTRLGAGDTARGHIRAISEADLVVDADGNVLKARGDEGPTRINIAELRRVLTTQARPHKADENDREG